LYTRYILVWIRKDDGLISKDGGPSSEKGGPYNNTFGEAPERIYMNSEALGIISRTSRCLG